VRDGWIKRRLSECLRLKSGESLTSKAMKGGRFPVYGGNGIAGKHDDFNVSGRNVIVGRVGALCGIARHITEEIWLTDNAFKVVDVKHEFDNRFLTYCRIIKTYAVSQGKPLSPLYPIHLLKISSLPFRYPYMNNNASSPFWMKPSRASPPQPPMLKRTSPMPESYLKATCKASLKIKARIGTKRKWLMHAVSLLVV